jgi:hypothetical protein
MTRVMILRGVAALLSPASKALTARPPAVMLGLGLSAGEAGRLPPCSPPLPLGIDGSKLEGSPASLHR